MKARTQKDVRKNLEDDAQLLAVDVIAPIANRPDLANRVALLPVVVWVLGEAPDCLGLVAVGVLEWISAVVRDQVRVGVVGRRVEGAPGIRDRGITPFVAQLAELAVPLHTCVVRAIQARKLLGSRRRLADGVLNDHRGRGKGTDDPWSGRSQRSQLRCTAMT